MRGASYAKGRRLEWAVKGVLENRGWIVVMASTKPLTHQHMENFLKFLRIKPEDRREEVR